MIDVFTLRGTGERINGPQLLDDVTSRLDPNRFRCIPVDYPASVGAANPQRNPLGPSLKQSLEVGKHALAQAIYLTPNRAGLIGYSLGAYVISEFLEDMQRGAPYTLGCEIDFVATVANPRRLRSWDGSTFGIAGAHGPWPAGPAYYEVANPHDGICCCPDGSPLRTLSDALDAFTFAVGGGWSIDLAERVRRGRWQPTHIDWWRDPIGTWNAYREAAQLMSGYLGLEHTSAYLIDGHTSRLATAINQEVR